MKIPHDKFCILPWISIETSPIGTVRPCCLADHEILDESGKKMSLGEVSLENIRGSEYMKRLRRQFLNAERPDTCRRCWAEESAGRRSKRMHTLDRLKHMIDHESWTDDAKQLAFMDLKLGNICNLKCRICGSWSSSTFAAEEIRYQENKKDNFHYVMMKLGRWPREEQRFWQDLERHMAGLKYLEFTGGEPFMIQEHFDLLQKLVDHGYATDIEIHYNTNGTIFPINAEKIWQSFKHVEIAFSIDDVGERFEYQRSNAQWEGVNANIEMFKQIRSRNNNISLQVCTTVNVFNVFYLSDVADWIDQQDFDFVYWNMLHDAPQFCIANLSRKAKDQIEKTLCNAEFSPKNQIEISRIIDFMRHGSCDLTDDLKKSISQLDQRREEDITVVAPELARAIDYVKT